MPSRVATSARLSDEAAGASRTPGSSLTSSSARQGVRKTSSIAGTSARSPPVLASHNNNASSSSSSSLLLTTVWAKPPRSRSLVVDSPRRPPASSSSSCCDGEAAAQQQHQRQRRRPSAGAAGRTSARASVSGPGTSRASSGRSSVSNLANAGPDERPGAATSHRRVLTRPLLQRRASAETRSGLKPNARTEDAASRSVFPTSAAASLGQPEQRAAATTHNADPSTSNDTHSEKSHAAERQEKEQGRRCHSAGSRPPPQLQPHSPSSCDSSVASSPLLHPADAPLSATLPRGAYGSALLLATVPVVRSPAAARETGSEGEGDAAAGAAAGSALARTYAPGRNGAATDVEASAARTSTSSVSSARRGGPRDGHTPTAASDKPWLQQPEGRGILKRRTSLRPRHGTILIASTPTGKGPARDASHSLATSLAPGGPAAVHVTKLQSPRAIRHVRFDEANIEYLAASASHVIHCDSQLGVQLDNVEWGAVMMSPSTAQAYSSSRRADSGTAVSLGKAKPSAWGADSEWFNSEFEAQLEPHADHSDLSSPAITPAVLGAPDASTSLLSTASSSSPQPTTSPGASVRGKARVRRASSGRQRHEQSAGRRDGGPTPLSSTAGVCGATFPVPRRGSLTAPAPAAAAATAEGVEGGPHVSSPVLAYERAPLLATTRPLATSSPPSWAAHTLNPVSPRTASANDAYVPAPPLSVGALRHRSPAAAAPSSPQSSLGDSRGRSTGSRPRLSSPGVSFAQVDLASLQIDDDGDDRDVRDAGVDPNGAAGTTRSCGAARLRKSPADRAPAAAASAAGAEEDSNRSGDVGEVPSASVLELSETERRLLRAVMHVNQRPSRPVISPDSPPRPAAANGSAAGSDNRALRASVRTLGDPRAEVLSSGIRNFLGGPRPTGEGERGRAVSPSPAATPPATSSSASWGGGGSRLSDSTGRIRLASTQLGLSAAGGGSDAVAGGPSPTSTVITTPLSMNSVESPSKVCATRGGGSGGTDSSGVPGSLSQTTGATRGSSCDGFRVPAALATRRVRRMEPGTGGEVVDGGALVQEQQPLAQTVQPPPPRRPPALRQRNAKPVPRSDEKDDDSDDAEPHLRAPVPTPRSAAASAAASTRRKSM